MAYDYKLLLDALIGYRSEETRRSHRNVSVTAFIILTAKLVGLKLTDVTAFGIAVTENAVLPVLCIATALLFYWLAMFLVHWNRDREIEKERTRILEEFMHPIMKRHDAIRAKEKDGDKNKPSDWPETKAAVAAYQRQQERTRRAATLQGFTQKAEIFVPITLAIVAAIVLVTWFIDALSA